MAKPLTRAQWRKRKGGFKTYERYRRWWNSQQAAAAKRYDTGYATPQQISRMAAAQAASVIGPERTVLEQQREEARRYAQQQQRDLAGYSQAAAQQLTQIAPQIQQGYADASTRQASFSKGFSDGLQMAVDKSAGQINADLAKFGAPQGAQVKPQGVNASDVLYGTTGYLPATQLEHEGAAFTAAARMLPATELAAGRRRIEESMREAASQDREFAAELLALEQKRPGIIAEITQGLAEDQLNRRQFGLQSRAQQVQEEYLRNSLRETGAKITGFDPVTGQPTYESVAEQAAANAAAAKERAGAAAERASQRSKAVNNRADALSNANQLVFDAAQDWGGEPITNENQGRFTSRGKYIAKQGQSEFGDGTTNDPAKAQRSGALSYEQALVRALGMPAVQELMRRYGISQKVARAKVRKWLGQAGIKPPKRRAKTRRPRTVRGSRGDARTTGRR